MQNTVIGMARWFICFSGCNSGHKKKPVACDPTATRSIRTFAYTSDFSELVLHPFVVLDTRSAIFLKKLIQICCIHTSTCYYNIVLFLSYTIHWTKIWLVYYMSIKLNKVILIYLLRKAGTKHRQLVSIAPFMTSKLGSTTYTNITNPKTWRVSIMSTNMKSNMGGLLHDLKKQILNDRIKVPISGTMNANNRHHIHATRSSVGKLTMYNLSRPVKKNNE